MALTKEKAAFILDALKRRGALKACDLCGAAQFTLLDEFIALPAHRANAPSDFQPPPALPAAALYCNRCGQLRFHHLAPLGVAP